MDYPNRALDREAYEKLRNPHKVDYSLFEAYQNIKAKRGERDVADRYATLHGTWFFWPTLTPPKLQDAFAAQ